VDGVTDSSASDFVPIPELSLSSADVTLIFLTSNGVIYWNQTEDPWYRATVPFGRVKQFDGQVHPVYRPEEAASPLACAQQMQFCNAAGQCGPLASSSDAVAGAASVFNTTADIVDNSTYVPDGPIASRFYWFYLVIFETTDWGGVRAQVNGEPNLASQAMLSGGLMQPIPDNQWQADVTFWWATWMATMQSAFVITATGPSGALQGVSQRPNQFQQDICQNQGSKAFV
jgi:hypothetical protein